MPLHQRGSTRYQGRISGPLLDRIDIQIELAAVAPLILSHDVDGEPSAATAARVDAAYQRQMRRQHQSNQRLPTREIDHHCRLDPESERVLQLCTSMQQFHWSARAYHRVFKVARTIADLAAADRITAEHVSESVQYRPGLRER